MQCRDLVQFFYTQEKAIFHFDVTQFDINYVLDVPFLSFSSSYCFPLSYALRGYKCLFFSLFSKPFRLNIFYYIPIYYTVGLYRSSNNLLGSHPKTFQLQLFVVLFLFFFNVVVFCLIILGGCFCCVFFVLGFLFLNNCLFRLFDVVFLFLFHKYGKQEIAQY